MVKIQKRKLAPNELVALNFIILGISLDNEKSIKMNDTYDRYFFTMVSIYVHQTEKWCLMIVY